MRRFRRHPDRVLDVEITPMIDVVFLLIIFFMTTAQFVRVTREKLELPQEAGEQEPEGEEAGVLINMRRDGTLVVNSQTLTLEEVADLVLEEIDSRADRNAAQVKLLIRADRNADTTALNDLVTRLERLGVGAARLATEVPR